MNGRPIYIGDVRVTRVVVVTDSAASLPPSVARSLGVVTIPVHIHLDKDSFLEDVNVDAEKVARAQILGAELSTVAPSPDEIAKVYRAVARDGATAIVSIHVSSAFSQTMANATVAAKRSKVPVTLVDSGTIAMGQALVALGAAAVAADGRPAEEVAGSALAIARSCRFLFTVETLEYLRRGGRVSAMVRAFGTLLKIRPVVSIQDAQSTIVDRVVGYDKAQNVIQSSLELYATTLAHPVALMGMPAGSTPDPSKVPSIRGPVLKTVVGGSLMTHTGPGTCGLAVADMPPEFGRLSDTLAVADG